MKHTQGARKASVKQKVIVAAVASACATGAFAIELDMPDGWRGSINTTLSVSSTWRAQAADKALLNNVNAAQRDAGRAGLASSLTGSPLPAQYLRAGYTAGAADDYNLNYDKGDQVSEQYKVLSEFTFTNGDSGGLFRVKGWYDDALNNDNVPWGNQASGYAPNQPLSDRTMGRLNKFNGAELLDAYLYTSFHVAELPLQVRLGRMAMNWGESVFIKGVNDNARLDISALRKPGTELKEALLPTYAMSFNLGLPAGMSLDGFYQFKHDPHNIDECGTFWAPTNTSFSTNANECPASEIAGGNRFGYNAGIAFNGTGAPKSKENIDGGEFGLAFRFPVESLDAEVGLYAMNTHAKAPVLSLRMGGDLRNQFMNTALTAVPGTPTLSQFVTNAVSAAAAAGIASNVFMTPVNGNAAALGALFAAGAPLNGLATAFPAARTQLLGIAAGVTPSTGYWHYAEDIQTYGISFATTLAGWSVAAELSHQHDVPVMFNGNDLIQGILNGMGPLASGQLGVGNAQNGLPVFTTSASTNIANQTPLPAGSTVEGFKRVNKTQFQFNGLVTVPSNFLGFLGNSNGLFVAEAGFQWADLPKGYRFGRGFVMGTAAGANYNTAGAVTAGSGTSFQCANIGVVARVGPDGCKDEGFATDFSWGYRMRASLNYPQVFGTSWEATPSLFIGHDVEGYSIDGQFNEGRLSVGYGLEFNLNKEHKINLNYNWFSDSADYDVFRDHDNYSVSYSYTF